jgi:hypothetical protein
LIARRGLGPLPFTAETTKAQALARDNNDPPGHRRRRFFSAGFSGWTQAVSDRFQHDLLWQSPARLSRHENRRLRL